MGLNTPISNHLSDKWAVHPDIKGNITKSKCACVKWDVVIGGLTCRWADTEHWKGLRQYSESKLLVLDGTWGVTGRAIQILSKVTISHKITLTHASPPSFCNSIRTTILKRTCFACPLFWTLFTPAVSPPTLPPTLYRQFLLHCTACSLAVLPESWGFMTSGSSGGLEKASILRGSKASSVVKTDTVGKFRSPNIT